MSPDWIQAGASVLTMFAAIAALIIAAKAPRLAAEFAEKFRRQSAAEEERQKLRMTVFVALMKSRAEILAVDARAAINLVDVAFADVGPVRDARRLFIEATLKENNATAIVERYHALIGAVAAAVGMGDEIGSFDIRTGYYPIGAGRLDEAAVAQAEEKIARRETAKAFGQALKDYKPSGA